MPIRRGTFATPAFIERGRLRRMLIGRIASDPAFGAELRALYDTHVAPLHELPHWVELPDYVSPQSGLETAGPGFSDDRAIIAYVAAVRALAARWGLDRLIEPRRKLGAELIFRWCQRRRRDDPELSVDRLVEGFNVAGHIAEIGEVVSTLEGVTLVDPIVRPIVHIAIDDKWDPERELRSTARKRLMRRAARKIRTELDRLQEDADAKGYVFPDTRPKLDRDLERLFQLMTGRATLGDLAARTAAGTGRGRRKVESGIHQSVARIAKRGGVSIRGWGVKSVKTARRRTS